MMSHRWACIAGIPASHGSSSVKAAWLSCNCAAPPPAPAAQLPLFDDGWAGGWHGDEGWHDGFLPGASDGEAGSLSSSQREPHMGQVPEMREAEGEERPPAVWRFTRPPPTQVCFQHCSTYLSGRLLELQPAAAMRRLAWLPVLAA